MDIYHLNMYSLLIKNIEKNKKESVVNSIMMMINMNNAAANNNNGNNNNGFERCSSRCFTIILVNSEPFLAVMLQIYKSCAAHQLGLVV